MRYLTPASERVSRAFVAARLCFVSVFVGFTGCVNTPPRTTWNEPLVHINVPTSQSNNVDASSAEQPFSIGPYQFKASTTSEGLELQSLTQRVIEPIRIDVEVHLPQDWIIWIWLDDGRDESLQPAAAVRSRRLYERDYLHDRSKIRIPWSEFRMLGASSRNAERIGIRLVANSKLGFIWLKLDGE